MALKHYPEEFKADAVALYLSDPAKTYRQVAEDLGTQARCTAPGPALVGPPHR
jgi:transposase-like protein